MKRNLIALIIFGIMLLTVFCQEGFSMEWVYPVGNPNSDTVRETQRFMNYLQGYGYHNGVDIGRGRSSDVDYQPDNKTIRAVAHGRVIYVGTGYNHGWGNTIVIRHDFLSSNRYIFSSYSHMEDNSLKVELNHEVQAGQPIGIMGNTGISTAIHLHFMIFTTNNGSSTWDDFTYTDLGKYLLASDLPAGYNINAGDLITYGRTTFYNPLLFVKYARLAAIAPPSVQKYGVNSDALAANPSSIRLNRTNTVEVTVATYRTEISMYLALRHQDSGDNIGVGGDMNLTNRAYTSWIMSEEYDPLGRDCDNGGWNCERALTYSYDFSFGNYDPSSVNIAIFWKPLFYESSLLILPIPGGVAHNTIRNTGRYVYRTVE